jgi:Undecaprenyl-phosphate glucose phosphotransferase
VVIQATPVGSIDRHDRDPREGAVIKRSSQPLAVWFLTWDLTLTAAAWLDAYVLRFDSGWFAVTKERPDFWLCLTSLPLVVLCVAVAFRYAGLYHVHRLRRFREEVVAVGKGVALATLLVMATGFTLQNPFESRLTVGLFAVLAGLFVLAARRLTWAAVRRLRSRGWNASRAIIVGTGRVARKTTRALRHASWMGIRNVGYVEDSPSPQAHGLDVLGTTADLPELIAKHNIEHVFIALPLGRFHEARRVFDILSRHLVEVRLVLDVPDMAGVSLTTTTIDGLPLVGLRESPHFGLNVVVKRVVDVVLASVALVLLSPLMLLVAALVKLTSPGPVFYRQERCGLNGRPFQMLKFRSMRENAEAETGAVWTKENDPRRTRLGEFLRKTSIDELPQLFNVLWGDMSLVGPRPERPEFVQRFRRTIPNYMARHCVKAGMTGWAQVHGWRGNTSLRRRVQFDLYYITHWNPWLDIRIMWLTVVRVLFQRSAY